MFFPKKDNRNTWWKSRERAKVPSITEIFGLDEPLTPIDEPCDELMEMCGCTEHEEAISLIAYFKWLDAGCKENTDLNDWLEAEKEYWQATIEDHDQAIMEISMEEERQYAQQYLDYHS